MCRKKVKSQHYDCAMAPAFRITPVFEELTLMKIINMGSSFSFLAIRREEICKKSRYYIFADSFTTAW